MKISLNWLKSYLEFNLPNEELKDLLTDIGLEVESMESYESVKGGLKGLIVGHVIEKEKHPDADKLSVCKVDTGHEILQIVCGAPNVAAGQKVIVALTGSKLFSAEGEPFEIKKAKIRGVESNGMICAEDEIGLGSSHEGILILDANIPTGKSVSDLFNIENDYVIEIGLTPNRTDAFSHIGVARDLAAALSFRNNKEYKLLIPEEKLKVASNPEKDFTVEVKNKVACPRYSGLIIKNIKVAESPAWLKNRLKAIGQKPINNIVDITNFVLHEFGQPLHAFDLSEIKGKKIVVGNLPSKTKFTALDKSVIELHEEDLMICDGEGNGMCIAGVYGGIASGVKDSTTSIFLESAYFDPKTIRRTSTRHNLRTEAAIHFEKGIDPDITVTALKRAAQLITEIAGGEIASPVYDLQNKIFEPFKVELEYDHVKRLTGADISKEDIIKILGLLDIRIDEEVDAYPMNISPDALSLSLLVPPYRADVTREADVIEEILRIYGFNNVLIPAKLNASLNFTDPFDPDKLYNRTADTLVDFGFYEMMNNSITKSKYQSNLKNSPEENWVRLLSSINVELDVMRNNMLFSGLEVLSYNINHKNSNIKLFEFGKTYELKNSKAITSDSYSEKNHLAIFLSGNTYAGNWKTPSHKTDFYNLKSLVDLVLSKIGISDIDAMDNELSEIFDYSLVYKNSGNKLVEFGKVQAQFNRLFDIKQEVYFADFDWDNIISLAKNVNINYKEISKYPAVKRDLALLLDKKVKFSEVKSIGEKFGKKILRNIELFDIYEDDKIGKENKSYAVSFTFRDDNKTLLDTDIESVMSKLIKEFQTQLNAVIR
ncbi:MAG: Phenylalanyl-tRNA synthetase beta chain [Bacteroidota bacterium]|nr:Phenylalanyl-tRNA synthetase beta chain [Bacteroidota bacterium]